jgi:hypothetical protein
MGLTRRSEQARSGIELYNKEGHKEESLRKR